MKFCNRCKIDKPESEFYKKTGATLQPSCKDCYKVINKENSIKYRESILKSKKEYYKNNKEVIIKKVTKWNKEHPEQRSKYMTFVNSVRRGRKLANGGSFTKAKWNKLVELHDSCCFYCKEKFDKLTIDHFIPLSKGGSNFIDNIVPACSRCNNLKGSKLPEVWQPNLN